MLGCFNQMIGSPDFWSCIQPYSRCKVCSHRKDKRKMCKYYKYDTIVTYNDVAKIMHIAADVGCGEMWIDAATVLFERGDTLQFWQKVEKTLPKVVSKMKKSYITNVNADPIEWLIVNHRLDNTLIVSSIYESSISGNYEVARYLLTNFPHVQFRKISLNRVIEEVSKRRYTDILELLLKIPNKNIGLEGYYLKTHVYISDIYETYHHTPPYANSHSVEDTLKYIRETGSKSSFGTSLNGQLLSHFRKKIVQELDRVRKDFAHQVLKDYTPEKGVSIYKIQKENVMPHSIDIRSSSDVLAKDRVHIVRWLFANRKRFTSSHGESFPLKYRSFFHDAFESGSLKIAKWCLLNSDEIRQQVNIRNYLLCSIELSKTNESYFNFFKFLIGLRPNIDRSELVFYAAASNQKPIVVWLCESEFERRPFHKDPRFILSYKYSENSIGSRSFSYKMVQLLKEYGFIKD